MGVVATSDEYEKHLAFYETVDFTIDGKCSQCGQCCSNQLPMSRKEIKDIHRYVKKHKIKERKHLLPLVGPINDMTCPFLDCSKAKLKCTIYPVRSGVCRAFTCKSKSESFQNFKVMRGERTIIDVREEFFSRDYQSEESESMRMTGFSKG